MTQFGSHLPHPSQYSIFTKQNVVLAQDATLYTGSIGSDTTENQTDVASFATFKCASMRVA